MEESIVALQENIIPELNTLLKKLKRIKGNGTYDTHYIYERISDIQKLVSELTNQEMFGTVPGLKRIQPDTPCCTVKTKKKRRRIARYNTGMLARLFLESTEHVEMI